MNIGDTILAKTEKMLGDEYETRTYHQASTIALALLPTFALNAMVEVPRRPPSTEARRRAVGAGNSEPHAVLCHAVRHRVQRLGPILGARVVHRRDRRRRLRRDRRASDAAQTA